MTKSLTPEILKYAKMCMDVYNPLADHPGKFIQSVETDAELYVALVEDTACVVCRGTDSAREWVQNFMWDQVPFITEHRQNSDEKIHTGFMLQYLSIKDKAFEELNKIVQDEECKKVLFIGHSLGAGISNILAYAYYPMCELPIEVVGFGGPRFCNHELRQSFNRDIPNCTRVVNDLDGVTLVPLASSGYCHVGNLIHIKEGEEFSEELTWFGWAVWVFRSTVSYVTETVTDHLIWNYVEEIEKCLAKNQN